MVADRARNPRSPILVRVGLLLVLAGAAALRFYGLNWDGGHWLHPDERQIYFVTLGLGWPRSLVEALSPNSPLNPKFFAYGSLPIYLLKLVAGLVAPLSPTLANPDNLHLVGRPLAALFDLGTVYLTYRLANQVFRTFYQGWKLWVGSLLASALVGLAVLHIQLAHFYTVDPLLTFFVMLTLSLAVDVARGQGRWSRVGLSMAFGLALATKISAFPLVLAVLVAHYTEAINTGSLSPAPGRHLLVVLRRLISTFLVAGAVCLVVQPYVLIDWRTFVEQTLHQAEIARGTVGVPYTIQYTGTWPFLYSMWQTALWGLGLPLGLAVWAGFAALIARWLRRGLWADSLLLSWAGPYFVIAGLLHTRYLRYMLPLVPILCILSVRLLLDLKLRRSPTLGRASVVVGGGLLSLGTLAYTLVFSGIYAAPHSWVVASEWIYRNVPADQTLAVEHWDMQLPFPVDLNDPSVLQSDHTVHTLTLYDEPDDAAKWQGLTRDLAASDYVIVASRRLYGSVTRAPDRYPVTSRYYDHLFSGTLGFELAEEFTRGPVWLNPRIQPLAGAAPWLFCPDESFVVYDHPRALVFRNVQHLSSDELLRRLGLG
jgi:hypothetical protein